MGDLPEGQIPGYSASVWRLGVVEVDDAIGWGLRGRHVQEVLVNRPEFQLVPEDDVFILQVYGKT